MAIKGFENNILLQADDFCEAYYRCSRGENPHKEGAVEVSHAVNVPAIVNAAFACELYMKAIIGREFQTHSLLTFYKNLPEDVKQRIEEKYKNNKAWGFETAKEAISAVKDTFVDWRYLYKEENANQCNPRDLNAFLRIFQTLIPILKEEAHIYLDK